MYNAKYTSTFSLYACTLVPRVLVVHSACECVDYRGLPIAMYICTYVRGGTCNNYMLLQYTRTL